MALLQKKWGFILAIAGCNVILASCLINVSNRVVLEGKSKSCSFGAVRGFGFARSNLRRRTLLKSTVNKKKPTWFPTKATSDDVLNYHVTVKSLFLRHVSILLF